MNLLTNQKQVSCFQVSLWHHFRTRLYAGCGPTCRGLRRSAQPRSSLVPPWSVSWAGSASPPPLWREEELHRQTASPEQKHTQHHNMVSARRLSRVGRFAKTRGWDILMGCVCTSYIRAIKFAAPFHSPLTRSAGESAWSSCHGQRVVQTNAHVHIGTHSSEGKPPVFNNNTLLSHTDTHNPKDMTPSSSWSEFKAPA